MRASVLALAVVTGCGFKSGSTASVPDDGASGPDSSAVDAPPADSAALDGKAEPICIGTYVTVCIDPPSGVPDLPSQTIDTGSSALCVPYTSPQAVDACVIAGQSITVNGGVTLQIIGTKRLIFASTSSITIAGTVDAASHVATKRVGPAGDSGPCSTNYHDPTFGLQGGGGWGGSFGAAGGNGGNGAHAGTGGIAASAPGAMKLRGGCPGSAGGGLANYAGPKGHGGGAVALLAGSSISVPGTLNASGGGGSGGHGSGGGGGGGTGGMIVLDAVSNVTVSGKVFANGGAGGEGSSSTTDGASGGESAAPDQPGRSGDAAGTGGNGGAGGTAASASGSNGQPGEGVTGGGGAGGGGVGVIKVLGGTQSGTDDPAHVSPAPS